MLRAARVLAAAAIVLFGAVELASGAWTSPQGGGPVADASRSPAARKQTLLRVPLARPGDVTIARYVIDVAPRTKRRASSAKGASRPNLNLRGRSVPGGAALQAVLRRHHRNKNRFVLLITSMRPLDAPASLDPDAVTELVVAAGIRGRVTRTFTVVNLFTSFNAPPKLPSSDASFLSGPVPHFDLALGGAPRAGLRGSFLSLEVGKKAKPVSPKLRSRLLRRVGRYLGLGEAKLEPPGAGGGGTPSPGPSPGPGTGPPGPDPAPPPPGPPGPPPPPGPPTTTTAAATTDLGVQCRGLVVR